MLGKSLTSLLLTSEVVACSPFMHSDLALPTSNLVLLKRNSSCIVRSFNMSKRWKIRSADQIRDAVILEGEEEKTWEGCTQALSTFEFTPEEAGIMLGKAFGWIHSPYWGEERRKEVPKDESVIEVLDYLKNLGLSNDDLHKLLKKFPEVLGCGLDDEVKPNVATLEKEWGIKGKSLRNLLLRNPKVLGYNVDCKGDCMAKCTRCWVRF